MTMNAKKCKEIRKVLRGADQDWRDSEYLPVKYHEKLLPVPHQVVNTIRLDPECGRKTYKDYKSFSAGNLGG
jgi:hypothetical protein